MNFIFFIISTMMIVLINQHSTMGLPVEHKAAEKSCSEGFKMASGRCVPMESELDENGIPSSLFPSEDASSHEERPLGQADAHHKSDACPEGMKKDKHGICQEIKHNVTTEVSVEATTARMEKPLGEENRRGCPEGTERDEQGSCLDIKSTRPAKTPIDPKLFLQKNGDCPENFKKFQGQCLYIKPKTNSTDADNVLSGMRSKGGNDGGKLPLTTVLFDNSCPQGTEYKEHGVCQQRIHSPTPIIPIRSDGKCPDDYELVDGKCTHKSSMLRKKSGLTTMDKLKNSQPVVGISNGVIKIH